MRAQLQSNQSDGRTDLASRPLSYDVSSNSSLRDDRVSIDHRVRCSTNLFSTGIYLTATPVTSIDSWVVPIFVQQPLITRGERSCCCRQSRSIGKVLSRTPLSFTLCEARFFPGLSFSVRTVLKMIPRMEALMFVDCVSKDTGKKPYRVCRHHKMMT